MGKLIALGPGGTAQAPARRDVCRPVIELVREQGWLDRLLLSSACKTEAEAADLARDLYRSARYYCSCGGRNCARRNPNYATEKNPEGGCPEGGQRISVAASVVKVTDERTGRIKAWHVQFRVHDKREAMREVARKYGPDPNAWPYFARRKQLKGQ